MLQQMHYINEILKRHNFHNEHSRRAPMETGLNLAPTIDQSNEERTYMKGIPYMNMIGALRYAADCTRPDIAYPTGQLARYLNEPGIQHYNAAKHCFQYLKGTAAHWLVLGGNEPLQLEAYTDADGMSTHGHKPILGYTFKLGNSLVSWSSKRATLVTISVCEAEMLALSHATQEAIALKNICNETLRVSYDPTTIHCDNAATISIVHSPDEQHTQRTKHFSIRKSFIHDRIETKWINVKYIPTNDQQADLLTKPIAHQSHYFPKQL